MTPTLRLHQLRPSPNTVKVRLALAYKGLAYEGVDIDPLDRASVVAVSGQPRAPVLEHGDVVVFDSGAILRYLDANFRDAGPRLFTEDYDGMGAIEEWERYRFELGPPIGALFGQFRAGTADAAGAAAACAQLHAATARLEARLAEGPWLVGASPTAADFTVAPFARLGMLTAEAADGSPPLEFFREHLTLGEDRARTRDWVTRTLAFER